MVIIDKKLVKIYILCIICIFIGAGCSNKTADYEPTIYSVTLKTNSSDLKEISAQIIKKYLNEYEKDKTSIKLKLEDYTVNNIDDIKGNTNKFSFWVDYSVKPSDENSNWIAGNGEIKDGWIINKIAFVNIEKENNEYKIISIGTGP
ncbi:MAG: hypothetical protein ACM3X7_13840 [Solirubrobacterales bacterium]